MIFSKLAEPVAIERRFFTEKPRVFALRENAIEVLGCADVFETTNAIFQNKTMA